MIPKMAIATLLRVLQSEKALGGADAERGTTEPPSSPCRQDHDDDASRIISTPIGVHRDTGARSRPARAASAAEPAKVSVKRRGR